MAEIWHLQCERMIREKEGLNVRTSARGSPFNITINDTIAVNDYLGDGTKDSMAKGQQSHKILVVNAFAQPSNCLRIGNFGKEWIADERLGVDRVCDDVWCSC